MSLTAKIGLAALIAVSVSAAAAARPPKEIRPGLTGLVLGASVVLYAVAAALLLSSSQTAGAVLLIVASEGMCVAAWLGRAIVGGDDDDGGGGGGGSDRTPPDSNPGGDGEQPGLDWGSFESLRRSWSRERTPTSGDGD